MIYAEKKTVKLKIYSIFFALSIIEKYSDILHTDNMDTLKKSAKVYS